MLFGIQYTYTTYYTLLIQQTRYKCKGGYIVDTSKISKVLCENNI